MSEELYIFGGIAICILLVFLMLKIRKKTKTEKIAGVAVGVSALRKPPPPLPVRISSSLPPRSPSLRALDYPKCPLDRSRNEPGKPQVVFWDNANQCYTCHHGHHFTGKE